MAKKVALTVAGSDSSGGAGIQADLKAFQLAGVEGASVIACCVAENTQRVYEIAPLSPDFVAAQIRSVFDDLNPSSTKTGMLYSKEIVEVVSSSLKKYRVNPVVDPVLIATVGDRLSEKNLVAALTEHLIPLARVITPNTWEARELTNIEIKTLEDARKASEKLRDLGAKRVLIKGIRDPKGYASDLLFDGDRFHTLSLPELNLEVHGTGCAFSALIAGNLARGIELIGAITLAKGIVWLMMKHSRKLGKGVRMLNFDAPSAYPFPTVTKGADESR